MIKPAPILFPFEGVGVGELLGEVEGELLGVEVGLAPGAKLNEIRYMVCLDLKKK